MHDVSFFSVPCMTYNVLTEPINHHRNVYRSTACDVGIIRIRRRSIHQHLILHEQGLHEQGLHEQGLHEQGHGIVDVAYTPFCAIPDPLSHSRSVVHLQYLCPGTQKSKDVVCWKLLLS